MSDGIRTVLIITSHYPPNVGGIESHLQALVGGLVKRCLNVLVSTYQPLASERKVSFRENYGRLTIFRMPWLGFNLVHRLYNYPFFEFIYLFPGLFAMSFFVAFKYRKSIDVIHCQGLVPIAVGVVLGRLFSRKVVGSIHNLYFFPISGLYPLFSKLIFDLADLILVPTNISREELIRIGVSAAKINFFKYWIDLSQFRPADKRKLRSDFGWNRFTIFFVGRLIETKGISLLLEVAKSLEFGAQFVIAGTGPLQDSVMAYEKRHANLCYLGRVENATLPSYYSACDLVVVPSLVDEGFGFVVMEAVACGTPVLASNKGGLSDAVSSATGRLVCPSSRCFLREIRRFLKDPSILRRLSKGSRKYAEKNFSERNIQHILEAYGNNVGKPSG